VANAFRTELRVENALRKATGKFPASIRCGALDAYDALCREQDGEKS